MYTSRRCKASRYAAVSLAQNYCNTLQHTARHRHTLPHPAILFNTLPTYSRRCITSRTTASSSALWYCKHCNTLQHTASRRNTLQHTATSCKKLQHPTDLLAKKLQLENCSLLIRPSKLQHTATYCHSLQHNATHYNILQHLPAAASSFAPGHCNTLQRTLQHTLQHTIIPYNALPRNRTPVLQHTATHCSTLPTCSRRCSDSRVAASSSALRVSRSSRIADTSISNRRCSPSDSATAPQNPAKVQYAMTT